MGCMKMSNILTLGALTAEKCTKQKRQQHCGTPCSRGSAMEPQVSLLTERKGPVVTIFQLLDIFRTSLATFDVKYGEYITKFRKVTQKIPWDWSQSNCCSWNISEYISWQLVYF